MEVPKGYKLNPDEKHVAKIVRSLNGMEVHLGKPYCPCRPIRSDKTICPCVSNFDDCVCKLYVKE
jgi:ferredoxin-thioredoxin reductase catalytic subunit